MVRFSLPLRLLVLLIGSILPAMAALAYVQLGLRHERTERVTESAQHQAQLLSANVETIIDGARQVTGAIAQFDATQALTPGCADQLRELRDSLGSYAVLEVASLDGTVICAAGKPTAGDFRSDLAAAMRTGRFAVGRYTRLSDGTAVLPMIRPSSDSNGPRGAVIAAIDLRWLAQHFKNFRSNNANSLNISDNQGTILVRLPQGDRWVGKSVVAAARGLVNAAGPGVVELTGLDGMRRVVGYVPVSGTGGPYVAYGVYLPAVMAAIDQAAWRGYALIAIRALITMLLMIVITRRLVHAPAEALLDAAQRWSSGDLSARARLRVPEGSEFAQLGSAYNAMAEALDARRRQLEDLNASLELRVADRTKALSETNNRLQIEIVERERTDAALRTTQKLQAVGQLAGGMAHEFNNLLTTVLGALELLRARLGDNPKLQGYVTSASDAARRGARLTSQMLAFARRRRLMPVAVDLNAVLTEMRELLDGTLGRGILLQLDLAGDLWPALGDRHEVEAAILNLALNARDAMERGGTLRISTVNTTLGAFADGSPGRNTAELAGEFVELSVTDNGIGMTEEELGHAIHPFFTTKAPGQGAGLGLSQVHGMAQQLGGDLQLRSSVGIGTTATLRLPRACDMISECQVRDGAQQSRSNASLLLVDDDDQVRQIASDMLSELGYHVTSVANGSDAIALLRQSHTDFNTLVADYSMPGMTGAQLISEARRLRPELLTLLITGYMDFASADEAADLSAREVLRKPFTLSELAGRIEELARIRASEQAPA